MRSVHRTLCAARTSSPSTKRKFNPKPIPCRRRKLLAKLGPLEIDQARKQMAADQDEKSLAVLEHYRDEVRETVTALTGAGINAEKHPGGFKELHIGLRETIRRFDDFIVTVPVEKRPWFRAVRSDLSNRRIRCWMRSFPSPARTKKAKPLACRRRPCV